MQDYNATSVLTFDKHAEKYAEKYFALRDYDKYYELICANAPEGRYQFLDLACGPGNAAAFIRGRYPNAEILCVDKSPRMLVEARKRVANIEVLLADCRDISEIKHQFHAAAFCFGLSYFDDVDACKVLSELFRVLMPNGLILLATVAGDPSLTGVQTNAVGDSVISYYRQLIDIENLIQYAGFKLEHSATVPSPANATVQSNDVIVLARKS